MDSIIEITRRNNQFRIKTQEGRIFNIPNMSDALVVLTSEFGLDENEAQQLLQRALNVSK